MVGPNMFRQAVRAGLSAAVPKSRFVTRMPRRSQSLYLTFDDGPHPEWTPRILDVLASHSARATFFTIGKEVQQNGPLVRRIIAEGHALGSHTFTHPRPQSLSIEQFQQEMERTHRVLEDVTGDPVHLYRPPYGKVTARQFLNLWNAGRRIALWNRDPRDYAAADSTELVRRFHGSTLQAGDVVLLHDNQPVTADGLDRCLKSVSSDLTFRSL